MIEQKQVAKEHYAFGQYLDKYRWNSVWHQIDEVTRLQLNRVLEIGPGLGLFKAVAAVFDIKVETLDLDPELKPDHVASATALPFADGAYDAVCGFQILEHLPYDLSLKAFGEMTRVARRNVVISLPDAKAMWPYALHIPKRGTVSVLVPEPSMGAKAHTFDGQHYWEINKRGYELKKVIADFSSVCKLVKTYRVAENPYHRFFVFAKES
jgi:SAM-dependent methyltransferase